MSKYVIKNGTFVELSDNHLMHRQVVSPSAQQSNKNFKYYAKVDIGKTTRYFYTKAEWLAYNQKQKLANQAVAKKEQAAPASTKSTATSTKSTATTLATLGKKIVSALLKAVGAKVVRAEEASSDPTDNNNEVNTAKMDPEIRRYREFLARRMVADKKSEQESPKSWDELVHKDGEYTKEQDQAAVNPNYDPSWMKYSENCVNCTLAYDVRLRGYDVEAAPYNQYETFKPTIDEVSTWYKGITEDNWLVNRLDTTTDDVYDRSWENKSGIPDFTAIGFNETKAAIKTMPDDSYGQFCVYWSSGGAHSMVWEKSKDKVVLRDCQTNKTYDYDQYVKQYGLYVIQTSVLRTDNLELTDAALRRIRNKKEAD